MRPGSWTNGCRPLDDSLSRKYKALQPTLDRCLEEGRAVLTTLLGHLGQAHLVRARIANARVKSLSSIQRKAERNAWPESEALDSLTDLVGFRIVCNNLEDVHRIKDALLASPRFRHGVDCVQDFIESPQQSGYRAIHVGLRYDVIGVVKTAVACEIQLRTLAQETWARLSHYDLYKQGDSLPPYMLKLGVSLAEILNTADRTAQDIREDVSRPLAGVAASNGEIRPEALSFIYRRAFGEEPSEYFMVVAAQSCHELQCYRLDLLDRVVMDEEVRRRISRAYASEASWEPSDETVFLLCITAAVSELEQAEQEASDLARQEVAEIEAIARREQEIELPESFDEFIQTFYDEDRELDATAIYQVADRFAALKRCVCGAPIIDVDAFVEEVVDHYGLDADPDGKLVDWLVNCGIETGDFDNSDLCSYHGWVMSKED